MVDPTASGPLNPIPSVPTSPDPTPVAPQEDTSQSDKDAIVGQKNFEDYLNQQTIMHEEQVQEAKVYDAADDIGQNSIYLKPGETRPT